MLEANNAPHPCWCSDPRLFDLTRFPETMIKMQPFYTDKGFVSPPKTKHGFKRSEVLQFKERRYQTGCIFSFWPCELLLGVTPNGSGGVIFSLFEASADINIIRCKLAEAWNGGGGYTTNVNGGQPRERDVCASDAATPPK